MSIHPGGRNRDANREWPIRATAARPTRHSSRQKQKAKPIDLSIAAVGQQHHPIHTKNKEAQEFFNQGITLIYAFNHEEAARSFRLAAELDATSPMPLWGIALAVGPNYNSNVDAEVERLAFETIQKAQQLATAAPQVEKDYVAALATRYSGDANPDYKQLSQNYAAAMKALSAKYPDDLDAATMYAESLMDLNPWKLWSADGKPAENTVEIVTVLESVLARNPGRAGANHYYIHAVEASSNPARALPSARRLDTMLPQAGHLVHMPTHIYERTGDFDLAARNNAEAARVDRWYAERAGQVGSIYDLMYHSHNEHFEAMAASMEGNYAQARKAADSMAARLLPHAKMMPMLDGFIMAPIWVDVRFGKWQEVLSRPEPMKELADVFASPRAGGERQGGGEGTRIVCGRGRSVSSGCQLRRNEQSERRAGRGRARGRWAIAAAKGHKDAAIEHWTKAVAIQEPLNYDEPADWYYPVRESLGAALLAAGNAPEAERVFRVDLQ